MRPRRLISGEVAVPAGATVGLLVPLAAIDRRLQTTGGPGIIPFELAGPGESESILEQWGEKGRRWAIISLVLDFPFLVAYTTLTLRLLTRLSTRALSRGDGVLAPLQRPTAVLQVVAGASDAIENAALLVVVLRRGDPRCAALARRASRTKFATLGVVSAYAATVLVARVPRR